MSTSLATTLKDYGFEEKVYTRIGVDYGGNAETLWSMAGQGNISEITTTGLHTSLAAKMQLNATNNGIVVGDHIVSLSDEKYYTKCCNRKNKPNLAISSKTQTKIFDILSMISFGTNT
jgi:hypothetical protein